MQRNCGKLSQLYVRRDMYSGTSCENRLQRRAPHRLLDAADGVNGVDVRDSHGWRALAAIANSLGWPRQRKQQVDDDLPGLRRDEVNMSAVTSRTGVADEWNEK
jgi:hypothetical protein